MKNEERDSILEKEYAKQELNTLIHISIAVIILWLFSSKIVERIFIELQGREIYLAIIGVVILLIFLMLIKDTITSIVSYFLRKKK